MAPLWSPPPSSGKVEFKVAKYDKEYISTTLHTSAQGYSLAVDTSGRKLILRSGDNVLGMAKRFGKVFRVFRVKPNYQGQEPSGKLRRANDAPLYFHSSVRRKHVSELKRIVPSKGKNMCVSVLRLGRCDDETFIIEPGDTNSFEKTCVDAQTQYEVAFWKYHAKLNHVEVLRDEGSSNRDVGLMVLLTIIADLLHGDEMMDDAAVAAVSG